MAVTLANAVSFYAVSGGTGNFVFGAARSSFLTLQQAITQGEIADGATVAYLAQDQLPSPQQREWGHGTVNAGTNSISRTTVLGWVDANGKAGSGTPLDFTGTSPPLVSLTVLAGDVGSGGLIPATGNLTFYVATTGNDSNSGLSVGSPVATLQRAMTLAASYDYLFLYTWSINIADGTYTTTGDAVIIPAFVHLQPSSTQNLVGNSGSPGNVVLKCGNGLVQTADAINNQVFLDGFTVHLTAGGGTYFGIFGGKILYNNLTIDADASLTATAVFWVGNSDLGGTNVLIDTNGGNTFTVNNGVAFRNFILANPSSQSNFNFTQFTFPASLTTTAWVNATAAQINWSFNTYTNFAGVTGKQCQASVFCLLITDNGLPSDFPGNTAGTVDNTTVMRDASTGIRTLGSLQHAGVPAASTFPNQTWQVFKDTSGGGVYLGFNDGGTMVLISNRVQLPSFTISTLPGPVAGMVAYITDGDSGLAWGATAVNSGAGATKYLVWYNGTNWTVTGK